MTKEDVGKILRMQWLGGAEPLDLVADRGVHCTAIVCVCARARVLCTLIRACMCNFSRPHVRIRQWLMCAFVAGNETIHVVVQPEDVEISNGSPPSNVRAQTDRDAALAWQIHENDAALLAVEAEASASSVTC